MQNQRNGADVPGTPGEPGSAGAGKRSGRRLDDVPVLVFELGESGAAGAPLESFEPTPAQLASTAFLIDLGADRALLVPAADAHVLPRGAGGEELRARAAAAAGALRRERDWVRRRLLMPDHMMRYADQLQGAEREADVYEALRAAAAPVVGAYTAVVYVGIEQATGAQFHPLGDTSLPSRPEPIPAEAAALLARDRLVTRDSQLPPGLDALLAGFEAAQLLASPLSEDALLVLVERRRDRVFTGEDRNLLDALVRGAELVLGRIARDREATALAASDPVTGLPAGRILESLLRQALYRAGRGHPLAVLLLELDVAATGEDGLHWLTAALNSELRLSDVPLRQDANRFVVLLPDTDAAGARLVAERIRDYIGQAGVLRTGIAIYGPEQDTTETLLRAAAADLEAGGSPP